MNWHGNRWAKEEENRLLQELHEINDKFYKIFKIL